MRNIFIAVLICLFVTAFSSVEAQPEKLTLTGSVNGNGKKIEAATVSLLQAKDSSLVKIAVTDKDGNFALEKINNGSFIISIEAIGFYKYYSHSFTTAGQNYTMPLIALLASDGVAGGVVVTSKRPLIENKIDKTVVNVDASPTNTGLTALEVLEK